MKKVFFAALLLLVGIVINAQTGGLKSTDQLPQSTANDSKTTTMINPVITEGSGEFEEIKTDLKQAVETLKVVTNTSFGNTDSTKNEQDTTNHMTQERADQAIADAEAMVIAAEKRMEKIEHGVALNKDKVAGARDRVKRALENDDITQAKATQRYQQIDLTESYVTKIDPEIELLKSKIEQLKVLIDNY